MIFTSLMKFQVKKESYHLFLFIVFLSIFMIGESASAAPPFMDFEGVGGGGIVPGSYLVNPPEKGQLIGMPAVSHWSLIGGGNYVYTNGFAFSFLKRFELGYVLEICNFHRLRRNLRHDSNGDINVKEGSIYMSNIHFKTLLVEEMKYIPAFAVTAEFKFNDTIATMNKNIGHALDTVGYDDSHGIDIDFTFSKTINDLFNLPSIINMPCIINANLRLTRGHYLGLLGFSSAYTLNKELSLEFQPHPKFAFGYEFREQNDSFRPLPLKDCSMNENTFWDINIAFFPNDEFSLAVAFTRFGNIVNRDINFFVCNLKYDF
jgi:Protein of unknown function (DUF3034).